MIVIAKAIRGRLFDPLNFAVSLGTLVVAGGVVATEFPEEKSGLDIVCAGGLSSTAGTTVTILFIVSEAVPLLSGVGGRKFKPGMMLSLLSTDRPSSSAHPITMATRIIMEYFDVAFRWDIFRLDSFDSPLDSIFPFPRVAQPRRIKNSLSVSIFFL